jgi:hypothetical protein
MSLTFPAISSVDASPVFRIVARTPAGSVAAHDVRLDLEAVVDLADVAEEDRPAVHALRRGCR